MAILGAGATNSKSNLGGYVAYNNVYFRSPRFRSRLEQIPEESADGRTTLCNNYRLTVRGIITDDGQGYRAFMASAGSPGIDNRKTDQYNARSNLQQIQSRLSYKGGHLIIRGLGKDIEINSGAPGCLVDVRFGPRTTKLVFDSIGGGVVHEVLWECEFSLPQCSRSVADGHSGYTAASGNSADVSWIGFPYSTWGQLEGFVFDVGYTIDQSGLTQRVVSGEYSVFLARASTTGEGTEASMMETADSAMLTITAKIRDSISPPIPPYFRRTQSSWRLSPDKRKMTFLIVDTELAGENNYPLGIVDLDVTHTVDVQGQVAALAPYVSCTFSGFFEVRKNYALGAAWDKIILIMQNRLDKARANILSADPSLPANANLIIITGMMISEPLYGQRRVSFAVNYIIMNLNANLLFTGLPTYTGLFGLLTDSGGNQIFNQTGPTGWQTDLVSSKVWGNRGIANLQFQTDDDQIVGPCDNADQNFLVGDTYSTLLPVTSGGGSLTSDCPPNSKNYMEWYDRVTINCNNETIIHQPLGTPFPSSGSYNAGAVSELKGQTTDSDGTTLLDNVPLSLAYRQPDTGLENTGSFANAGSKIEIILSVKAVRVGAPPEILKANVDKFHQLYDQGKLIPGDSHVTVSRKGKLGKCTVYEGENWVSYTLTNLTAPADIKAALGAINESLTLTEDDQTGTKLGGKLDKE